jgi:hypothetical protein
MWNIGPLNTSNNIHTPKYLQNMYPKVGLVEKTTAEGKEGKK